MSHCIFCKILNEESPCWKVYEDKNHLVILPKEPHAESHKIEAVSPLPSYKWPKEDSSLTQTDSDEGC